MTSWGSLMPSDDSAAGAPAVFRALPRPWRRRVGRRTVLPPRVAFVVVGGVLVVALWASGSASMVYPAFAARWRVGEVVTTGLFAVYPVSLVLALVVSGSLSDTLGRRRVLLIGITVVGAGTAVIASSGDIAPVYAGRALQGAGVGVAMSAASTALVELTPRGEKTLATTVNTATTAAGTVIALVAGGALVQLSPTTATTTPFLLLLGATTALLPLLYFLPETLPAHRRRPWRPSPIRPPITSRLAFTAGVTCLTVAFMVGAVYIALGAQILTDLIAVSSTLIAATALACWAITIIPASLVGRRMAPAAAATTGGLLVLLGSGALVVAAATTQLSTFAAAAVVNGAGYGLTFHGGLNMVTQSATPTTLAGALALMYLVAYSAQGLTAVLIGWLATTLDLQPAITLSMAVMAALGTAVSLTVTALRSRVGSVR